MKGNQKVVTTTAISVWLKIKQEGANRRFWSMFLLTRGTHFGTIGFDPRQPYVNVSFLRESPWLALKEHQKEIHQISIEPFQMVFDPPKGNPVVRATSILAFLG